MNDALSVICIDGLMYFKQNYEETMLTKVYYSLKNILIDTVMPHYILSILEEKLIGLIGWKLSIFILE